jgi:hypothetical protein
VHNNFRSYRKVKGNKKMDENYSLSPKDCLYISDLLNHTSNFIKKTSYYYEIAMEEDVKNLLEDLNILLLTQYDDLVSMYEGAN